MGEEATEDTEITELVKETKLSVLCELCGKVDLFTLKPQMDTGKH